MQNHVIRSIILGAIAIGSTVGIVGVTVARADVPQMHVRYDDLDLHSQSGRKMLARRITRAADAVCGSEGGAYRLQEMECRDRALNGAEAALRQRGIDRF